MCCVVCTLCSLLISITSQAGHISFAKLLQKTQDLARGQSRLVDVDDWTWEIIVHYSEIKSKRFEHSHELSHSKKQDDKGDKKAGREIITSLGRYKSHSMDLHAEDDELNDHQDLRDFINQANLPGEETSADEEKKSEGGREAEAGGGNGVVINREHDEHELHHSKHMKEVGVDFEHTDLYEQALMKMQNESYSACDAVAKSLHTHMMSDLDLPLPLNHTMPVSNCENVAKQIILAWNGFVRPMGFLKQEIQGDEEAGGETEEVKLLFSELDYFETLIAKLQKIVKYNGVESDTADGNSGSRPMTAENSSLGDAQKRELQQLTTKSWMLLRHLCSNVKSTYCHEAALIDNEEFEGTKRDPLLNLDHPLKDNWIVGKTP